MGTTKICQLSGKSFDVTQSELDFYDRISPVIAGKKYRIPSPTLCPEERLRRRLAHRNERSFYHRKCDLSGKQFVSMYHPDSSYTIYEPTSWYSDEWDRMAYGSEIDFDRPFFEQFQTLASKVPHIGIDLVNCENSDYCNYCGDDKDCYLDIAGEGNYRSFYNLFTKYSQFAVDTTFVYNSATMYECMFCYDSSMLQYCMYTDSCDNCLYSFNLKNCSDCLLCSNLRGKKYHILNTAYTPEEYKEKKQRILTDRGKAFQMYKQVMQEAVHRDYYRLNCENCTGNDLANSKNCFSCFNINDCEESSYLYDVLEAKHCMDMNYSLYHPEWSYELISTLSMKSSAWSMASHYCRDTYYCDQCNNSEHIFGCISLNHAKYCILNTSYSKHEYETLVAKLIQHMSATGEWGEFFPHTLSAYGYNETVAQEYFPISKGDALGQKWNWVDEDERTGYMGAYYKPKSISQYDESIVGQTEARKNIQECLRGILKCEASGKAYKIISQELAFYIENKIEIPRLCPGQRHLERIDMRTPRRLWHRKCSDCSTDIQTSYSPSRKERVYCDACYRRRVY